MAVKEIDIKELSFNPFEKIGSEWALVTAGDERGYNTMTVSWGGVGVIWNKNVATVYIRPQRYTKRFVDEAGRFTLSFYAPEHKDALRVLGRKSGRDGDKVAEVGFTPEFVDGSTTFEQADLTFVCRTLYTDRIDPAGMVEDGIDAKNYPEHDYHHVYIAEVEHVYASVYADWTEFLQVNGLG